MDQHYMQMSVKELAAAAWFRFRAKGMSKECVDVAQEEQSSANMRAMTVNNSTSPPVDVNNSRSPPVDVDTLSAKMRAMTVENSTSSTAQKGGIQRTIAKPAGRARGARSLAARQRPAARTSHFKGGVSKSHRMAPPKLLTNPSPTRKPSDAGHNKHNKQHKKSQPKSTKTNAASSNTKSKSPGFKIKVTNKETWRQLLTVLLNHALPRINPLTDAQKVAILKNTKVIEFPGVEDVELNILHELGHVHYHQPPGSRMKWPHDSPTPVTGAGSA
jgi:hypothetical protein